MPKVCATLLNNSAVRLEVEPIKKVLRIRPASPVNVLLGLNKTLVPTKSEFMLSRTPQKILTQRLFSTFLFIFLSLFAATSRAQMGGIDPDPGSRGTGGTNTIEGRIYYPSGRNVDKAFKIRLSSGAKGVDFFTRSDDTGAFAFRRLSVGTYSLTVEGDSEYQTAHEQVDIFAGGRSYFLQIQLRHKPSKEKSGIVEAGLGTAPKPAAELYEKALEAERAGDNQKAIDQLQRAITLHPKFALALNKLGVLYQRIGKLDEAEKALSAVVELDPEVYELRLNYGIVLLKNKHYKEADLQFQKAIKLKDHTLARLFRGKTLIHLKNYADAESELQAVIKAGGDEVAMAHRFLGALYNERGETKQAIAALEKYLSLAPKARDAESVRDIIKQLRSQAGS